MSTSPRYYFYIVATALFTIVTGSDCPTTVEEHTVYKGSVQYLLSQNYDGINQTYTNNLTCHWRLRCQAAFLKVKVEVMDLQLDTTGSCSNDYVQFLDGSELTSSSLETLCTGTDKVITSTQQYMYIYFYTDANNTGIGFKLKYYAVEHDDVSALHTIIVAAVTVGGVLLIIFTILCCYSMCTGKRCICFCCRHSDRRTYPATESMVRDDTEFDFSPSKAMDTETEPKFMDRRTLKTADSPPPSYYRSRR